jgi:lysophospholipase L1-like esterase
MLKALRCAIVTLAILCALPTAPGADPGTPHPDASPLQWIAATDPRLEVDGLYWFKENGGELIRFPLRAKDKVAPPVWELASCPSGGRIRFRTDTKVLAIRLEYPSPPDMLNLHSLGQTGVDLYVDGIYRATAFADKSAAPGHVYERTYFRFEKEPRREREIILYLPLYKPVKVLGIGIDPEARVLPAHPFSTRKPIVFYGTSITQGGCASRPGLSYPALLGRMLDSDFVNLGFSGKGLGPPEEARLVSKIDASCFVLDYGINNGSVESLQKVYLPFLQTLRSQHPDTPILAVTLIYESREFWPGGEPPPWPAMREYIRSVVNQLREAGDQHLEVIDGTDLLGPSDGDGLADGTHPNDYGFRLMAERLAPHLRRLLGQ